MKIKHETECWRELITGWHPDANSLDDSRIDELADQLRSDVLTALAEQGITTERAHGQKVSAFAIVQSATDSEQSAFDTAVQTAVSHWK